MVWFPLPERGAANSNRTMCALKYPTCRLIILRASGPVHQLYTKPWAPEWSVQWDGLSRSIYSHAKNVLMYSGVSNLSISEHHSVTADSPEKPHPHPQSWMSQSLFYSTDLYSCLCTPPHALIRGNPSLRSSKAILLCHFLPDPASAPSNISWTVREKIICRAVKFVGPQSACCDCGKTDEEKVEAGRRRRKENDGVRQGGGSRVVVEVDAASWASPSCWRGCAQCSVVQRRGSLPVIATWMLLDSSALNMGSKPSHRLMCIQYY